MSQPTPSETLINTFIGTLTSLGGKAGNKKLQDNLNMSDKDYLWVRDYLIHEGRLKTGRGRGGSVQLLTGAAAEEAKAAILAKEEAASVSSTPMEEEEFNLAEVKSRFKKLPDVVEAFQPGMHVVRPMFNMFKEEGAWRHMKHYTVTKTMDGYVFVKPRPSRKDQVELSAPPEGFYEAVR